MCARDTPSCPSTGPHVPLPSSLDLTLTSSSSASLSPFHSLITHHVLVFLGPQVGQT